MSKKLDFAQAVQKSATSLAQVADEIINLQTVYIDRGYVGGGTDPIIDADIAVIGITAAEIGAVMTLATELSNFLNNSAVSTHDYDADLNKIRADI